MNTKVLLLLLILMSFSTFGQELKTEFKEYSYTDFFQLIEEEVNPIFSIHDVIVRYDKRTDSLFILNEGNISSRKTPLEINKILELNNVHFLSSFNGLNNSTRGVLCNIIFKERVNIKTMLNGIFFQCVFEKQFQNRTGEEISEIVDKDLFFGAKFSVSQSILKRSGLVNFFFGDIETPKIDLIFDKNDIYFQDSDISSRMEDLFFIQATNNRSVYITNNVFHNEGIVVCMSVENVNVRFSNNNIKDAYSHIELLQGKSYKDYLLADNIFGKPVFLDIDPFYPSYSFTLDQFSNQLYSERSWESFLKTKIDYGESRNYPTLNEATFGEFKDYQVSKEAIYDLEMSFKGELYNFYKAKFNTKNANTIYVNSKDLETSRLKYLNKENPSFDSFFTLKINQFLKVFSAYGTRPAKAIIFSMYVILVFAFIYLFFPNSWDRYGKHRIVHRYRFFAKYMNRQAGIHDVYLEEKQNELLEYEQFKNYMLAIEKTMPKFFITTALPLYKWAVSGTKTTASILKKIDFIKGKWTDIPAKKRWSKSLIITIVFLIALAYDFFIKILNAIMLSINTFTTLGFGEIPIKGFPRYLAIIQGFIGWFMLTIFSVSLISQLLN